MTRLKHALVLSLFAVACGGSTPEAAAPSSDATAPAAAETPAADAPAPSDKPAADGWEGEGAATGPATAPAAKSGASGAAQPEETRTLEVIQKLVKDHRPKVRECYDKARKDLPSLQGDMIIHFTVDPEGKVKVIDLNQERSTLKTAAVVDCAIAVIKGISFPPSSRGMESTVNYPFNFTPGGPAPR